MMVRDGRLLAVDTANLAWLRMKTPSERREYGVGAQESPSLSVPNAHDRYDNSTSWIVTVPQSVGEFNGKFALGNAPS